jgi:hypothetical protein
VAAERIETQGGEDDQRQLAAQAPPGAVKDEIARPSADKEEKGIGKVNQTQAIGPGADRPEGGQTPGDGQIKEEMPESPQGGKAEQGNDGSC